MEGEFLKILTNGGSQAILGFLCGWLLLKTIPSMEKTFRESLDKVIAENKAEMDKQRQQQYSEMEKQRRQQDIHNERLIEWLGNKAELPAYKPKDDRQ